MSLPDLPDNLSRRQLRKNILRMRLELHRQELRHEAQVMLQPLKQMNDLRHNWRSELGKHKRSLWLAGGAMLLTTLGVRSSNLRKWLRLAMVALPILRRKD
ncbi:hypothetical protein [Pseudomonas sp. 5P_3.1_Bac2]|uniref:hypothetical protein n=1 Tax=Pseudomonas sp. 5P_3.1_Bac2 TaxID=2971617 RepID=UPI0021C8429B|nr:hypothetical protein [Pseudomonas sp. 5P_3.1_Bac2]MCU1716552.1 hypothetical protein [Pseudomonas sp. 5P_3.1_Bac2]